MSVHDDQGHDEEAYIHHNDHHHWCNECPDKVSVWIQPASVRNQENQKGWLTVFGTLCGRMQQTVYIELDSDSIFTI